MLFNNQKFLITRFILILALMGSLAGISITPVVAAPGDTTLISLGSIASPLAANGSSYRPSISADGRYVTFYSGATNLVSDDTNGKLDIFVFDRQTDLAERVSVDSNRVQANGDSSFPSISADGRYVAFVSDATNLVSDDTNGKRDIFIHDRQTGLTRRVSAVPYEQADDSGYIPPALSADGRYVAYGMGAIFVFDCQTGMTERVSVGLGGIQANGASYSPSISADGRYVAYGSSASNLVSDDTNNVIDIFVFDRQTLQTERVSVDSSGVEANSSSNWLSISADGNYVAFGSDASNLVNDDTNSEHDIFVHDRQAGLTERVSVSSSGAEGNYNSAYPSISANGRYVAFASYASTLVSDDTNNSWDIFVHDRQTQVTERVSVDSSGVEGNLHSNYWASISSDGRYVAFESSSSNLDRLLQNAGIFVHDCETGETESVSVGPVGMYANYGSYVPSISADGRSIAFLSAASNLVSGDTNRLTDLFVYDRQTGSMELVSVSSSGVQTNNGAFEPSLSADGRYVVFDSQANNLVDDDTNGTFDVFVHDRQTGVTERVSVSSSGMQANSQSRFSSISGDGRYVTFESYASNLVSGDTGVGDIFLRDRQTGVTERISIAFSGGLPNNASNYPSISADGRYVSFRSRASNLVEGDTNGKEDIFVYDRQLGITELVSIDSSGLQANNHSSIPSISVDGRYVSFVSTATNLVPDDTNGVDDIFIHDRQTGETKRVSVDSSGVQATASSNFSSISANGRYISFASTASNLVSDDTNNMTDIFVHDSQTGITKRVAIDSSGVQANAASSSPSISANGQFIVFTSSASNLVYGDGNYVNDVFLHEDNVLPDTPPTVFSIIRADANPTSASSMDFAVTFSEDVTGVNTTAPFNDFTLTTTGVIGASIVAVSGSGNSYTVTVNTGTGSGTIRLDVTDNDSIEDVAGNKLGGISTGNGDFITGEVYDVYKTITKSIESINVQDGWTLESSETSNKGGTMNSTANLLYVGDNAQDKQYRSLLSFDTSSLPEDAVITNIQLKIKVQGFVGNNVFTPTKTHGNLLMDIRNPYFGTSAELVASDFQAGASKNNVGVLSSAPGTGWYTITLKTASFPFVNLTGTTQFRLRFQKDDNDDLGADYLKIYSGNAGAASRPQLIVEYSVP